MPLLTVPDPDSYDPGEEAHSEMGSAAGGDALWLVIDAMSEKLEDAIDGVSALGEDEAYQQLGQMLSEVAAVYDEVMDEDPLDFLRAALENDWYLAFSTTLDLGRLG